MGLGLVDGHEGELPAQVPRPVLFPREAKDLHRLSDLPEAPGDLSLEPVEPEFLCMPDRPQEAATLSERSDDQGSWLIGVAALATGSTSVACHDLRLKRTPEWEV